jgi:transposase
MIPIPSGVRVWLATGHTDMLRGMNSLALQVQEGLKRDPHAGLAWWRPARRSWPTCLTASIGATQWRADRAERSLHAAHHHVADISPEMPAVVAAQEIASRSWQSRAKARRTASPFQQLNSSTSEQSAGTLRYPQVGRALTSWRMATAGSISPARSCGPRRGHLPLQRSTMFARATPSVVLTVFAGYLPAAASATEPKQS